jgi:hypothetical protein
VSDAAAESAGTNGPHDGERGSFLDGYLNRPLIRFAHLAVLVTFAFGQPLFDLLSKEPEFFASRGSKAIDIFVFALCVTVVPAAVLLGIERLAGLASKRAEQVLHFVFIGLLAAIFSLYVLVKYIATDAPTTILFALALALGAGGAYLYRLLARATEIRSLVAVLSAGAVAFFLINFLFISSVSKLTLPDDAEAKKTQVSSQAPVILLGMDEFPTTTLLNSKGRIDAKRYPNFARLAKDSTWFPRASGVHDRTTKAYPAILDGKQPDNKSLPTAADHPDSVFTVFGEDYDLSNVNESATRVCPPELCTGQKQEGLGDRITSLADDLKVVYGQVKLPKDLAAELPSISNTLGNFGGDGGGGGQGGGAPAGDAQAPGTGSGQEQVKQLEQGIIAKVRGSGRVADYQRWVQNIGGGKRPSLNFNHIFFPHVPWQYLPSGKQYMKGPEEVIAGQSERTITDQFLVDQTYQRHLLQTAFTDRLLGQLIDTLERKGIYDKALIVVLADHGATFTKGEDRRVVSNRNIADMAGVPFFVKAPDQKRGAVDDAYVKTIDVVPTIADVLNIELPYKTDGVSVFSDEVKQRDSVEMIQGEQATIGGGTGVVAKAGKREFEAKQAATVRRMIGLFGEGDPGKIFRFGPNKELIGRRASALPKASGGGAKADVFRSGDLRDVDLKSGFIPLEVGGRITGGGAPKKRDLAVAVNGRIAAVGESFPGPLNKDVENYAMFAPESAFRNGRNRVEVYEVTGSGALARLGGGP